MSWKTKKGTYGTLYLYSVSYQDKADPDNTGVVQIWAYNPEHAEDRFHDNPDDGWEMVGRPSRVVR